MSQPLRQNESVAGYTNLACESILQCKEWYFNYKMGESRGGGEGARGGWGGGERGQVAGMLYM